MKTPSLATYQRDPIGFIDRFITRDEKGRPFKLAPHQRRVLELAMRWDDHGQLLLKVFLWGEAKKSGKTALAAVLLAWWSFTNPHTEVICAANDLDQSVGRVFRTFVAILKQNSTLAKSARILAESVELSNGTIVTAISSDYKSAAGSRHSLVIYDELWGYSLERSERLFEELTPPPTELNSWVLVVSYAGWTGESVILERLYKRGLAGERIDDDLEVYRNDDLTMFWSHTPRQPWQTEKYYASQREILRPGTFARLHRNEWVSSESSFIEPEAWDSCIDNDLLPALFTDGPSALDRLVVTAGIDASVRNDSSAVVVVAHVESRIRLICHRIWRPTKAEPMNYETTIEAFLREIDRRFILQACYYDPFQLHQTCTALRMDGIRTIEFPQTVSNVTRMGQVLFDSITRRLLHMYPSSELREQALNAMAVEMPRGFKISKEKQSKKIDSTVALAMAVCCALDHPQQAPLQWIDLDMRPRGRSCAEIERANNEELERKREEGAIWLAAKIEAGGGVFFPGD